MRTAIPALVALIVSSVAATVSAPCTGQVDAGVTPGAGREPGARIRPCEAREPYVVHSHEVITEPDVEFTVEVFVDFCDCPALDRSFRVDVDADEVVIQEGALPSSLYLIKAGRAEVFIEEGGKEIIVGHLAAGDIFGEISLLLGRNHTASVRTVTRTELLMASKEDVEKILGSYSQIRKSLKQYGRERLEESRDKILISRDVEKKWV